MTGIFNLQIRKIYFNLAITASVNSVVESLPPKSSVNSPASKVLNKAFSILSAYLYSLIYRNISIADKRSAEGDTQTVRETAASKFKLREDH